MFNFFRKKKGKQQSVRRDLCASLAPFEILLPDKLRKGEPVDLQMGSKLVDILRSHMQDVQTLEIFEGMPVVNSNNPELKEFAFLVNGAQQTPALKAQIERMCFPPRQKSSIGVLCCLVEGVLHEFHVTPRGGGALINWQFNRVIHEKA